MATSEREELNDIIARVFEEQFGSRASHGEVSREVLEVLPRHILGHFASGAIKRQITAYFNRKIAGSDLPFAPVANSKGEHVQMELMDFSEYVFVATGYIDKGKRMYDKARVVGAEALSKFGKPIVVGGVNLSDKQGVA